MALFRTKEFITCLKLREDYSTEILNLPVDSMASDIITLEKDGKRKDSWCLIHQLLKPAYDIPGIKNGTPILIICDRDVRFDPLNELGDDWKEENVKKMMVRVAQEQLHKAEGHSGIGLLNKSMVLLSGSAGFLVLACILIGVLKFY